MWKRKADIESTGAKLIAVVKENLNDEVKEFREVAWPGPVYLDEQLHMYKAIHGGEMTFHSSASFFAALLNPFSSLWAIVTRSKKLGYSGNMKGEGFGKGGIYVVKKGGEVVLAHQENEMGKDIGGEFAGPAAVIEAAQKAKL
mmetsp:Transcript_36902/g.80671  ORF Transcript_36902/g.80671 Transcript_36902/m.80671 type:complete len:143 (-) Transcript_36902:193-621(-)